MMVYIDLFLIFKRLYKNFELIFSILIRILAIKIRGNHIRKVNQVIFTYIIILMIN